MRSEQVGASTSAAEVTNVSPHGFWILLDDNQRFLPFERFPWVAEVSIARLSRAERPFPHHLHWPELDIDRHVESIDDPDSYPLVSGARPDESRERAPAARSRRRRR